MTFARIHQYGGSTKIMAVSQWTLADGDSHKKAEEVKKCSLTGSERFTNNTSMFPPLMSVFQTKNRQPDPGGNADCLCNPVPAATQQEGAIRVSETQRDP